MTQFKASIGVNPDFFKISGSLIYSQDIRAIFVSGLACTSQI